jgi:serine/threonine-protein kinase
MSNLERLGTALADRYRLERELGAGGMATVYLAHDLKHDRQVAIKVLRPELAAVIGAERFLSEIRTTANLQHPHILPLHDSGEADSFLFYVMPFIEGESLRDRLEREKQLPVADAVRIAAEVAGALDYAHRRGVIHRDIKPENILLHDGSALVADFGIALAVKQAGGARLTQTGMSIGTPAYMAPEQAMGEKTLDARADVYALGAMTYEMLAGEPPFTGPTMQAIVARVMTERPRPLAEARESVTPGVAAAVHRALQKLPADRWSSARDFGEALATGDLAHGDTRDVGPGRRTVGRPNALLGAAALLATVAAAWGWWRRPPAPELPPPSRLSVLTPGLGGASTSLLRQLALSPDGHTLMYAALSADGASQTMLRPLDAATATPMSDVPPSTAGYVFNWDGSEFLGMGLDRRVTRHAVRGGPTRALQLASNSDWTGFAAWAPDGTIWLSRSGRSSGLVHLVERDRLVLLGPQTAGFLMQQVLDDNRSALVVRGTQGAAYGDLGLVDLRSGASRRLLDLPVVEARYSSGFIVCVMQDGTLTAVPFDPATGRVTGEPVDVAKGVALTGTGNAQFAVSRNGTVAYVPEQPRSLVLVDRLGSARNATPEQRNFHAPKFAPDGMRIATDFNSTDGRDVWVLTLADGLLARATFDRDGHDATWSPDGRSLTYVASVGAELDLRRTRIGSTSAPDSLLRARDLMTTGTWLPDGSALVTAATSLGANSGQDIGIVRNAGRGPIEPLVATPASEQYPAVSPDARWLAFSSDQSGREEVYVRPLGADGDQAQVSFSGGAEPVWAPDGRELFYRSEVPSPSLNVATVRAAGGTMQVTGRRVLFDARAYASATPHANYDIAPDGRSFVMVRLNPATEIVVLQNLPGLVRRLREGRQ